ncbi:MAG: hypothetical protein WBX38_12125 [Candidatus Sulfotelmatobacter sp.]
MTLSLMKVSKLQGVATLFLAAILAAPAWANTNNNSSQNSAVPGTLNYVEGQAYVADQPVDHNSVKNTTIEAGQTLSTEKGKAEILLTPGVFLREGDNTSVRMDDASLTDTRLTLNQGHAMIEVDQIYPQNDLQIVEGNATARIMKPGLYDFDLQQNEMRVFDGEAMVRIGDKQIKLKGDRELAVAANAPDKPQKFDKKAMAGDDLYRWSSLRSDYVAEANVDAGQLLVADGYGYGWGPYWNAGFWGPGFGPGFGGWYWDPWFSAYTFMPGAGIFYSPFGWGFYSPAFVYRAPFYGGHFYHTFNAANVRAWGPGPHYATSSAYARGVYTGAGAERGAFHSGPAMASAGRSGFNGGGFHSSGAGFHGGGGGGFRGGVR